MKLQKCKKKSINSYILFQNGASGEQKLASNLKQFKIKHNELNILAWVI